MNTRDQAYFTQRAVTEMDSALPQNQLNAKQSLAMTCRILAADGHESGLAGQISARDPEEAGKFLSLRFGYGFDEATEELIVQVDDDLMPSVKGRMANPAMRFHLWVYRSRPDVQAIVHTHPPYVSALSLTGQPLKVTHMDNTMLAGNVAHLPEWPGIPLADDEGRIISAALREKKAILLGHHGFLTAGTTIEEACYLAVFFERAARTQLLAMAAGAVLEVDQAKALESAKFLLQPSIVGATFAYWARRLTR